MSDIWIVATVLAGVIVLVVDRRRANAKDVIALYESSTRELRAQLDEVREKRSTDREEFRRELAEERERCSIQLAEMRGELTVLSGDFTSRVASSVADAVVKAVLATSAQKESHP